VILVVRPLAVLAAFVHTPVPRAERAFLAWFGVRGIGSLYYVAVAVALGGLSLESVADVVWIVMVCVIVSIVVHGVTGAPFSRRFGVR
jgi:NhaP-type Na+/H+ or K+/H+ antiporter